MGAIPNDGDPTSSTSRGGVAAAGTITVSGQVGGLQATNAKIVPGSDVLEFRLNKVNRNNPWFNEPRKDLREDIGAAVDPATGAFTFTFTGLPAEDVIDARDNGVDQILEWSPPLAGGAD